jgi:nucleoporin NUP42
VTIALHFVIGASQSTVPGSDKDEFPAPPGGAYGPGSKFGQQQGPYGQQAVSGQTPYGQQAVSGQTPYGQAAVSGQTPYGQQAVSGQTPYGQKADQKPARREGNSSEYVHCFSVIK